MNFNEDILRRLTQQNVRSVHNMPNASEQEQKGSDEAAEHVRSTLSQGPAAFQQLFALLHQLLGDVNCVVWVERPIDPCDINRRHQERDWSKLKAGIRKIKKRVKLIRIVREVIHIRSAMFCCSIKTNVSLVPFVVVMKKQNKTEKY